MAGNKAQHGHTVGGKQSPTYVVWHRMLDRCQNPNSPSYKSYGGKGITVCDRWKVFSNFLLDMGPRGEGMSLDRIDTSDGYCPGNCQWIPRSEQNREKRKPITFDGKTMCLPEWAAHLGVKRSTLAQRLYVYGWPVEKTFSTGGQIGC